MFLRSHQADLAGSGSSHHLTPESRSQTTSHSQLHAACAMVQFSFGSLPTLARETTETAGCTKRANLAHAIIQILHTANF